MAMKLLAFSELPEIQRGVGAVSKPAVAITSVGQFRFSKAAAEVLDGKSHIVIGYDDATRVLLFKGSNKPKEGSVHYENKPGKSGLYLSAAAVCKYLGYDYKAAGNQTFDASIDAAKAEVSIVVPSETPTPKPKRPRKTKAEVAAAKTAPAESAPESDDSDINLEDDE